MTKPLPKTFEKHFVYENSVVVFTPGVDVPVITFHERNSTIMDNIALCFSKQHSPGAVERVFAIYPIGTVRIDSIKFLFELAQDGTENENERFTDTFFEYLQQYTPRFYSIISIQNWKRHVQMLFFGLLGRILCGIPPTELDEWTHTTLELQCHNNTADVLECMLYDILGILNDKYITIRHVLPAGEAITCTLDSECKSAHVVEMYNSSLDSLMTSGTCKQRTCRPVFLLPTASPHVGPEFYHSLRNEYFIIQILCFAAYRALLVGGDHEHYLCNLSRSKEKVWTNLHIGHCPCHK